MKQKSKLQLDACWENLIPTALLWLSFLTHSIRWRKSYAFIRVKR